MKIELLRNCSHGSDIATYLISEGQSRRIMKAATTPDGISDLKAEWRGWNWFQALQHPGTGSPSCRVVLERPGYLKIEMDFIGGKQGAYRKGLVYNREFIEKVIGLYCARWPVAPDGRAPLHGDLSLENIFINEKGIHVIDWEHFALDAAPWGLDPLYLLFEALWYSLEKTKSPRQGELAVVAAGITSLARGHLSSEIAAHPLSFLLDFMRDHEFLWKKQAAKFPVLRYAPEQVCSIDQEVARLRAK